MAGALHIRPRYHRWHVDPGVEWVETHTGYAHLDWEIPLEQAALVLVDVWNNHYLADTAARAEAIIQERIRPLLAAGRVPGQVGAVRRLRPPRGAPAGGDRGHAGAAHHPPRRRPRR